MVFFIPKELDGLLQLSNLVKITFSFFFLKINEPILRCLSL